MGVVKVFENLNFEIYINTVGEGTYKYQIPDGPTLSAPDYPDYSTEYQLVGEGTYKRY